MLRNFMPVGLAAAFALVIGVPALAADNLDCALALADHETSSKIFTAYRADGNIGEALVEAQGVGLRACVERHGWSQESFEAAVRVILGDALGSGLAEEMAAAGLDMERLEPAIDDFLVRHPDEQPHFADGGTSGESVRTLIDGLEKADALGTAMLDEKTGRLIGEFASARANSLYYRTMFARQ